MRWRGPSLQLELAACSLPISDSKKAAAEGGSPGGAAMPISRGLCGPGEVPVYRKGHGAGLGAELTSWKGPSQGGVPGSTGHPPAVPQFPQM